MSIDLTPYFEKYEALVEKSEEAFNRVKASYAECVKCEEKCSDCCFALFDLTLIEALYLHQKFKEKYKGAAKVELVEKANRADRRIYKIKRKAFKELQSGRDEGELLAEMALEREPGLKILLTSRFSDKVPSDDRRARLLDPLLAKPYRQIEVAYRNPECAVRHVHRHT